LDQFPAVYSHQETCNQANKAPNIMWLAWFILNGTTWFHQTCTRHTQMPDVSSIAWTQQLSDTARATV